MLEMFWNILVNIFDEMLFEGTWKNMNKHQKHQKNEEKKEYANVMALLWRNFAPKAPEKTLRT